MAVTARLSSPEALLQKPEGELTFRDFLQVPRDQWTEITVDQASKWRETILNLLKRGPINELVTESCARRRPGFLDLSSQQDSQFRKKDEVAQFQSIHRDEASNLGLRILYILNICDRKLPNESDRGYSARDSFGGPLSMPLVHSWETHAIEIRHRTTLGARRVPSPSSDGSSSDE